MRKAHIVVMGKTGVGKSTLINAILGEKVAEIGDGTRGTKENKRYSKQIKKFVDTPIDLTIYDTVGLEIDKEITEKTVREIEKHIVEVQKETHADEVTAVWFCVNYKYPRFESYEIDLLKRLSVDQCIPFIIVITQCFDEPLSELEEYIHTELPEIPVVRILAEDKKIRTTVIKSYGLNDLLSLTINEYPKLKIQVSESKLQNIKDAEEERIQLLEAKGNFCVLEYSGKAGKAGWVPLLTIPYVHRLCFKMVDELNRIFGLCIQGEKFEDFVVGLVASPLMAIPLLSRLATEAYISSVGENYLKALTKLARKHSNIEVEDAETSLKLLKDVLGGRDEKKK